MWQPSDRFSLKLSALYQDYEADGPSEVPATPGADELQIAYLRDAGEFRKEVQLYSATLKADIGGIDLTSVTAYNVFKPLSTMDFSSAAVFRNLAQNNYGVSGIKQYDGRDFDKFSQEIRLSRSFGASLDALVGAFYSREAADQFQGMRPVNPDTGQVVGDDVFTALLPSTYKEYAAFTNLTLHATDRFDLQVGARESWISGSVQQTFLGPYAPAVLGQPSPLVYPPVELDADAFTYLLTPQIKVSPDLMIYARLASGYGAGGLNVVPGVPPQFEPDKTQNYELGLKAEMFDSELSFEVSVYHIVYKDIQLSFRNQSGLTYTGNGSKAKSDGVELSSSWRPVPGLTVSGWAAYNDAALTEPFPVGPSYGVPGNRLPSTSRFSGYCSLNQEFQIAGRWIGSVGGSASFVGERLGPFTSTPTRQVLPSYTKFDLRAGMTYDSWTTNLFIDNVTDERGVLFSDVRGATPVFYEIRPRTIGLSVTKSF